MSHGIRNAVTSLSGEEVSRAVFSFQIRVEFYIVITMTVLVIQHIISA